MGAGGATVDMAGQFSHWFTGFMTHLVTADALAAELTGGSPPVVLDVQFNLVGTSGRELYAAAHLPGAHHLDLDTALAGPPGSRGRHPLPDPHALQDGLRACGLDSLDDRIVTYDQRISLAAARAWWVLRWAGFTHVRVLDGGLAAWERAGHPVTTEALAAGRGSVVVRPGSLPALTTEDAARTAAAGQLLDVRAAERFRGEVEPIDPVAGHIPGARNLPMSDLLHDDGSFADPADIRARVEQLEVADGEPIGTSCGSGITAAQATLALAEAGIPSVPYIGSWSEWISDPERPVATGDQL